MGFIKKVGPIALFVFAISLIFGNLIIGYLEIDLFPTDSFGDIRNIIVFIGIIVLGFLLAYPSIDFKKIKIGEYFELEKGVENLPPTTTQNQDSSQQVIGKIRDNYLHLGNFRIENKKYIEAHSYYFCAHNMWPSILSSFQALLSFCYYLKQNKKNGTELSQEDIKTLVSWFNECLKNANEDRKVWKGREGLRDRILNIQKETLDEKIEKKAKSIIDKMTIQ